MLALPQAADNPAAWLEAAEICHQIHEDEIALQVLQEALTHFPLDRNVQLTMAEFNLSRRQLDDACNGFMRIYRQYPFARRAYLGLYNAQFAAGRYDAALKWLEKNEVCFFTADQLQMEQERLSALLNLADTAPPNGNFDGVRHKYIPILLYHGLSKNEHSDNLPIKQFERQMAALSHAGYTAITVEELAKTAEQGTGLPAKPILITADDARRDFFQLADPVLKKIGIRATMFVPTAFIEADHPFFADWPTIRKYKNSGRWDIQSHGHYAHQTIIIDAAGTHGKFLSNYQWLPASARQETRTEFARRVDKDYATARRVIEQNLGGMQVAGYAFPFSEAGQSGEGNVADALRVNYRCIRKYYRFGFIQDNSGYNGFNENQPAPYILRRFKVPNTWGGKELLEHLQMQYPPHRLAMERAKRSYVAGQFEKAQPAFESLTGKTGAMDKEVCYYLAAMDYQRRRYHCAARNMVKADLPSNIHHDAAMRHKYALKRNIQWMTSARLTPQYEYSADSDERRTRTISLRLDYPVENEIYLWITGGSTQFMETGQRDINADELTAGMDWRALLNLSVSASARLRNMHDDGDSANGWLCVQYGYIQHNIKAMIGKEDVDTLQARKDDLVADKFLIDYTHTFQNSWHLRLLGDRRNYSDGNHRYDAIARMAHPIPSAPQLEGGIDLTYMDAEKAAAAYYTPQDLYSAYLSAAYHLDDDQWKCYLKAGLGMVKEAERSSRLGGYCSLYLERKWRERWRFSMKLDYGNTSTYSHGTAYTAISYRF
jgi:hypothetical protein